MSYRKRMLQFIENSPLASIAVLSTITGDQCPCMISRDANNPRYSEEWHRNNTTADDCNKTGLINSVTVTTNIKGIAYPASMVNASNIQSGLTTLSQIGEMDATDIAWIGTLNLDSYEFISLSGYNDYNSKITYNDQDYFIKDVVGLVDVGESVILKRQS